MMTNLALIIVSGVINFIAVLLTRNFAVTANGKSVNPGERT